MELLGLRLCSRSLIELEEDVAPVLEPKFALSCCNTLAPAELGEMEASADRALLATVLSPAPIACTIAWISSELSV